jgi:hypothetical protein
MDALINKLWLVRFVGGEDWRQAGVGLVMNMALTMNLYLFIGTLHIITTKV